MRDTKYNHICPVCGVYKVNMQLHLRKYHPEDHRVEPKKRTSVTMNEHLASMQALVDDLKYIVDSAACFVNDAGSLFGIDLEKDWADATLASYLSKYQSGASTQKMKHEQDV